MNLQQNYATKSKNFGVKVTTDHISFHSLAFGRLFQDYCSNSEKISPFFEFNPFLSSEIQRKADSIRYKTSRKGLNEVLLEYNNINYEAVNANIRLLLEDERSLTVTTGQQLTVLGGPLFTLYKIVTAIGLSKKYTDLLGRPVIPVFWLADEDHDFPEVAGLGYPGPDSTWTTFTLKEPEAFGKPVGKINLDGNWSTFFEEVKKTLPQTEFTEDIVEIVQRAYVPGVNHSKAFGSLIQQIFGKYGLVLAGSASATAKKLMADDVVDLIAKSDDLYEALEQQSVSLEKDYHRQAAVSPSNWFICDNEDRRKKLHKDGDHWHCDGLSFNAHELMKFAAEHPQRMSPNVFMRPILQDILLPNIAYVAGPGEIAYYAQMKSMYEVAGMQMPAIVPRLSATIIESNIRKFLNELPFPLHDYGKRVEDLHKIYVESNQTLDIQHFANDWITKVEELANSKTDQIEQFEPTLVGTLVRVRQDQINAINTLRQKMIRAEKNRLDVQLKRISKVQLSLFPNMNLQERELAFIYPFAKYGTDFIDGLLSVVMEGNSESHLLVEL